MQSLMPMKSRSLFTLFFISAILLTGLACQLFEISLPASTPVSTFIPSQTSAPSATLPALLPPVPALPNEPVLITGDIHYTSPFFLNSIPASMVLLEDQAGFVRRDHQFKFSRIGQVIGPVQVLDDQRLSYSLSLPAIPNGVQVDVDNDGGKDLGVQVFAVAYWSNTWGDAFLEERDAHGWSTAYASSITDPENEDEIIGGTLIVWAPDSNQSFPVEFGPDGRLFTPDDPVSPIASGYSLVDLDQEPFRIYKEARPFLQLNEGEVALNDFSSLSYSDAFQAMFEKVSHEYPFTQEKDLDWTALKEQFTPRIAKVANDDDYYRILRDFSLEIPDGHVNVSVNSQVFNEESAGSFGLVLSELTDGRVIVAQVIPKTPAEQAGIQPGAEIIDWNGELISQAIAKVVPRFGPVSTAHNLRIAQAVFLTRVPKGTRLECSFINPGENQEQTVSLTAVVEYESLFKTFPSTGMDPLQLPVDGEVLDDSGLAYIRIISFLGDYQLIARLWEYNIQLIIDKKIPGLIIDLRANSGGRSDIPTQFAGYFFDETIPLYQTLYFSQVSGDFEPSGEPSRIEPAPLFFEGPIAVLVSPDCASACEGFAYALATGGRSIIVGHYPSAGAFGEVGRGQYSMPGEISIQFPTGRSVSLDGKLIIEGTGVIPDIIVPVTSDSAMGKIDAVLEAAVLALLEQIK